MSVIIDSETKKKITELSESELLILKQNRVGYTGDEKLFTINEILIEKLSENTETKKLGLLLKDLLGNKKRIIIEYKGVPVKTKFEKYRGWGCSIITLIIAVLFSYYIFSGRWIPR